MPIIIFNSLKKGTLSNMYKKLHRNVDYLFEVFFKLFGDVSTFFDRKFSQNLAYHDYHIQDHKKEVFGNIKIEKFQKKELTDMMTSLYRSTFR